MIFDPLINYRITNKQFMENKNVSRKKFLAWSVGVSSLLAVPAFLKFSNKKKKQSATAKMLTRDGKLIEIDVANIPSRKRKVKTEDIHTWVSRKTSL
jgi:hypothetical protein